MKKIHKPKNRIILLLNEFLELIRIILNLQFLYQLMVVHMKISKLNISETTKNSPGFKYLSIHGKKNRRHRKNALWNNRGDTFTFAEIKVILIA